MSKLRKILSFFLSLSLLATLMLPVSTAASDDVSPIEMTNFDTIGWSNDDMVYTPDVDAPIEALSLDILEADDSLYRVREEEEDLYTVVYRNSNTNLNTAYIFQHSLLLKSKFWMRTMLFSMVSISLMRFPMRYP